MNHYIAPLIRFLVIASLLPACAKKAFEDLLVFPFVRCFHFRFQVEGKNCPISLRVIIGIKMGICNGETKRDPRYPV